MGSVVEKPLISKTPDMIRMRPSEARDWQATWRILEPAFRAGKNLRLLLPDIGETEAHEVWIGKPLATFVCEDGGEILGTYYLKPNQPGLGSRVCSCGYRLGAGAEPRIASRMGGHSHPRTHSPPVPGNVAGARPTRGSRGPPR